MTALDPLVSVVIPCYNMEKHVATAVSSALSQTYRNLEVIAVNDASTDRTGEILEKFQRSDPRVHVIHRTTNSNLPAVPRNDGLRAATGEFVAFLDHDDLWSSQKIERQVEVLRRRPDVALAYSHLFSMKRYQPLFGFLTLPRRSNWMGEFDPLLRGNLIQCSSVIARRSILSEFRGFSEDPRLRAVEDYHLWFRVSRSYPIAFVPEIHGRYRILANSTSKSKMETEQTVFLNSVLGTCLPTKSSNLLKGWRRFREFPATTTALFVSAQARQLFGLGPKCLVHDMSLGDHDSNRQRTSSHQAGTCHPENPACDNW